MKDCSNIPPEAGSQLDKELRKHLDCIRTEDTPERLLDLARALQDMLRQREKPN